MIVFKVLICLIILALVPLMCGMMIVAGLKSPSAWLVYPAGFFLMLLVFELVCVPVVLLTKGSNFGYVAGIYTPLMTVAALLGLWRGKKSGFVAGVLSRIRSCRPDKETVIVWGIAGLILAVILILMETRVIFDGDDAYYVVQSLSAWQNGTLYSTNPYTGRAAAIDMRHALAVFTMWIAYVGRVTGIHTTILCHSVLPVVIIPLTLLVYGCIGSILLKDRRELLPYFVIFTEIIILFGRVSIYTPETFLLARAWQGKAVAANVLIPMTVLALLILASEYSDGTAGEAKGIIRDGRGSEWVLLALINASAGIFSSLAVELVSVLMATGGFVLAVRERRIRTFVLTCICCLPGFVYMLLYVYYTYFGWR